jgi:hypothetical protein
LESGSGRVRLAFTVGSCDINASVACANIGAFVPAAFIPSELNAAVASAANVT